MSEPSEDVREYKDIDPVLWWRWDPSERWLEKECNIKRLGSRPSPRLTSQCQNTPRLCDACKGRKAKYLLESSGVVRCVLLSVNHDEQNQDPRMPHSSPCELSRVWTSRWQISNAVAHRQIETETIKRKRRVRSCFSDTWPLKMPWSLGSLAVVTKQPL